MDKALDLTRVRTCIHAEIAGLLRALALPKSNPSPFGMKVLPPLARPCQYGRATSRQMRRPPI